MQREATHKLLQLIRSAEVDDAAPCIEFLLHGASGGMICECKDGDLLEGRFEGLELGATLILDTDRGQNREKLITDPELVIPEMTNLNLSSKPPHTVLVPRLARTGDVRRAGGEGSMIGTDVPHTLNVMHGQYPVLQIISAAIIAAWGKHLGRHIHGEVAATVQVAVDQVCGVGQPPCARFDYCLCSYLQFVVCVCY